MVKVKKPKSVCDVIPAEEALGEDKIKEIVSKEWNTAELPDKKDLEKEKHDSSMARNNPNSRANLIQYKKDKDPETKEKIVRAMQVKRRRPDKDLKALFGESMSDEAIHTFVNMRQALADAEEEDLFFGTIKLFVSDFAKEDLSFSDIDDISNLALNRVLELRLLTLAKKSPKMILDAGSTIERFRKNSEKLKMSLASRRMDRVDTKNKQSFSIVDLAAAFDTKQRDKLAAKEKELEDQRAKFVSKSTQRLTDGKDNTGD